MNRLVLFFAAAFSVLAVLGCHNDDAEVSPASSNSLRPRYTREGSADIVAPKELQRRKVEYHPPTDTPPAATLDVLFLDVAAENKPQFDDAKAVAEIVQRELEEHLKAEPLPDYGIVARGFTNGGQNLSGSESVYVKHTKTIMSWAQYRQSKYFRTDGDN
jgi:hypothetical protein